jgi:hypothetical protein
MVVDFMLDLLVGSKGLFIDAAVNNSVAAKALRGSAVEYNVSPEHLP